MTDENLNLWQARVHELQAAWAELNSKEGYDDDDGESFVARHERMDRAVELMAETPMPVEHSQQGEGIIMEDG